MMEFVYPHTHLVAGVDEVGRGRSSVLWSLQR
ncbi:Ribonuclease HII [Enterobacter cancerogenus]|uniref:Ribonuclease HII n=1 Tax=Enterobacter cancerogenus TaxID=69218 RepID=A0A484WUI7_9ENTR|nr:Ribonuclease HII [Enterobacter cancerogenus]